jgi:uncharacterized repeat protein (TIGR02543 family)
MLLKYKMESSKFDQGMVITMKYALRTILTCIMIFGMLLTTIPSFDFALPDPASSNSNPFKLLDEAYKVRIGRALERTGSAYTADPSVLTITNTNTDTDTDTDADADADADADENREGYLAVFRESADYDVLSDVLRDYDFQMIGPSRARTFWINTDAPEHFASEHSDLLSSFEQNRKVSLTKLDPDEVRKLWLERNPIRSSNPAAFTVNDPLASSQWAIQDMNLPEGWTISRGSNEVTVAVIDTGLHAAHEDFEHARILDGWDFITDDVVRGDLLGHGTRVTGIIAATMNNAKGIAGICAESMILPIQVFSADSYAYERELLQGIYFAADSGADVINLSLGSPEYSAAEKQAVNYALARGCIVIAASGNSGNSELQYPAALDGVISVSAYDSTNQIASFSTYNSKVSISAPGVNIPVMTKEGGYSASNGTSFAAPQISGIAALALALDTSLTGGTFLTLLQTTSIDLGTVGKDPYYGYGKVDAAALLEALPGSTVRPPPVDVQTSIIPQLIQLSNMEFLTDGIYEFYYGEYAFTPEVSGLYSFAAQSPGDSDIYFINAETDTIIGYDDSLDPFWCDITLEAGVPYILAIINYGDTEYFYTSTSFTLSTPALISGAGVLLSSGNQFNHWSQVLVPQNPRTGYQVALVDPGNPLDLYAAYAISSGNTVVNIGGGVSSGRKYITYSTTGDHQLRLDILSSVKDVDFRVIHDSVRQISQNIPYTENLINGDFLTAALFNPNSSGRYRFETNRPDATIEMVFQTTGETRYYESSSVDVDLVAGKAVFFYIHTDGSALTQTYSVRKLSSDALLGSIAHSKGTLNPAFLSEVYEYTLNIDDSPDPVTITAQSSHPGAMVTMDGLSVTSLEIDVLPGESQEVIIIVTSEDLSGYRTYTIAVTRSSDLCELLSYNGDHNEFSLHAETSTAQLVLPAESEALSFTVSEKADWALYSDADCTQIVDALHPGLTDGLNKLFLKVTAENGRDYKIYLLLIYQPEDPSNPPVTLVARDTQGHLLRDGEVTRFDVYLFAFGLPPLQLDCMIDGVAQTIDIVDPLQQEGEYAITLTDVNDSFATLNFVIDKTPPTVTGVDDTTTYYTPAYAFFEEGTALLNGEPYESGTIIGDEGDYTLLVTDIVGNTVTISFAVEKRVVTFIKNNNTGPTEHRVFDGETVARPDDPVKAHYDFVGWYQDPDLVHVWDFETLISSNLNLYAKWTIHKHTVVFDSRGGSPVLQMVLDYGAAIPRPEPPSREGYLFSGWYRDTAGTSDWNFNTDRLEGDLVLYAKWVLAVPDTVTSSIYTVNQTGFLISKIAAGTTKQVFLNGLGESQYIRIFKASTEITSGGELLGTGMLIKLMDGSTVKATYAVVVTGDINGDGKITLTDYVQLKTHLVGGTQLAGFYAKAGDVNGDGKITLTDFVQMKLHLLKKQNIAPQAY